VEGCAVIPQDPTMQLLGWAASRTAEAIVDRFADRAARKVKARVRQHVSEKRQLLSKRTGR
jgi:hypothetical protein